MTKTVNRWRGRDRKGSAVMQERANSLRDSHQMPSDPMLACENKRAVYYHKPQVF